MQPSDQDIEGLLNITGGAFSREEAISRLKGNNNNVDQAINEYFDDPGSQKYSRNWDESQFNSDRDGGQISHGVSFDVQGPDVHAPPIYNHYDGNGLASRPPSRTNNKSPLSKVIDLTAEAAAADPRSSMGFGQHEDKDLEQALAESMRDVGVPPQETASNTDEKHFGPANRSQYEIGKWDMVVAGSTSITEIVVDPEPAARKRDLDVPSFLKPSIKDHRLGALITIYHEIPIIRELFLPRAGVEQASNYGSDKEWWTGKAIEIPEIVGPETTPPNQINMELQRLMAFLDKTDRSYGSVEPLANLGDVKKAFETSESLEAALLNAWKHAIPGDQYGKHAKYSKIFSRGVSGADESSSTDFNILEIDLPKKDAVQDTLYDVADDLMWPDLQPLDIERAAFLSHVADVLAFRLKGDDDQKTVEIPATWYPDRYLKSSRQAALDMRLKKQEVHDKMRQSLELRRNLTDYHRPNGKLNKVKDILEAALRHDRVKPNENPDGLVPSPESPTILQELLLEEDPDPAALESAKKAEYLSAQLRTLMANIDNKLEALNEEKERSIVALRKLSDLYTTPSTDPAAPKLHKYTLRGVSTTKSTMYVCRRPEPDLIDVHLDDEQPKSNDGQWWRIHFENSSSTPVTVEKTTEEKVLEAAKSESKNLLLIYASEKAMEFSLDKKLLPTALENFVKADNKAFKAELAEDDPLESVSSPGKRKFDDVASSTETTPAPQRSDSGAFSKAEDTEMGSPNYLPTQDIAVHGGDDNEVIMGVDPGQEMQERGGMRMMGGLSPKSNGNVEEGMQTIDGMDLDEDEDLEEVVHDVMMVGESAAVRGVGGKE